MVSIHSSLSFVVLPLLIYTCAANSHSAERTSTLDAGSKTFTADTQQLPEMVLIPAGIFEMGSPDAEAGRYGNEGPRHTVSVAAFYMGKYEVTRAQFGLFVSATGHDMGSECSTSEAGKMQVRSGRNWLNPGYPQTDRDPVVCVSSDDAQAYVKWLSQVSRKTFQVPSEAQWEYVARSGSSSARPWGDNADDACRYANVMDASGKAQIAGVTWEAHHCDDGYAYSAPVGSFKANSFGIHDMIGNVWEWTQDCWNRSYDGAPVDGSAWMSGNCSRRANRGGGWYGEARDARSAYRDTLAANTRDANLGFRVARMMP